MEVIKCVNLLKFKKYAKQYMLKMNQNYCSYLNQHYLTTV